MCLVAVVVVVVVGHVVDVADIDTFLAFVLVTIVCGICLLLHNCILFVVDAVHSLISFGWYICFLVLLM